jgi:uncharacterized membrane protein YccC
MALQSLITEALQNLDAGQKDLARHTADQICREAQKIPPADWQLAIQIDNLDQDPRFHEQLRTS